MVLDVAQVTWEATLRYLRYKVPTVTNKVHLTYQTFTSSTKSSDDTASSNTSIPYHLAGVEVFELRNCKASH